MDIFSSFKCIACLLKTLKILHCVKKVLCGVIVAVMAGVAVMTLTQNKSEVKRMVKQIKKKVM